MRRLLFLLALTSLAFAPAPLPRPQRRADPPPALYGLWWMSTHKLLVQEGEMVYDPSGPVVNRYRLRFDPRASPPTYDLFHPSNKGDAPEWKGIYKVQGDVLTLTYNDGRLRRPTAFEGQGRGGALEVYRRVQR